MLTKKLISYDLLGLLTKMKPEDDSYSLRNIGFWIDNTRGTLIRQSFNKGQSLNPDIVQTIPCLEVQQIDASECPCEITGCTILRSKLQIPTTVECNQQNLITHISSNLLPSKPFTVIPYARASYANNSKFGKKGTKAFIHNRYVYLLTDTLYTKISLSGVFQYPEELNQYSDCSGNVCYTDDSYYPISNHMIETLKEMIIKVNFKLALETIPDEINDAK